MTRIVGIVLALAACDAGKGPAPAPIPPRPPPPAAPVPVPPPPPVAEVAPTIARWSTKPVEGHVSSPACVRANDRMIQYAELDGDRAARFCLWWNLRRFPDVGCWSVDLATGTYHGEGGVWFVTPQPGRGDHGETSVTIDDHDTATLTGTSLIVKHDDHVTGRLDVHGKGAIVLARSTDLVVPDRDGRVLLVDHDAKITRTIAPPVCTK